MDVICQHVLMDAFILDDVQENRMEYRKKCVFWFLFFLEQRA